MSRHRYTIIVDGKRVEGQIVYHKGSYYMTYAGLPNTPIRHVKPDPYLDKCREWRPM